MFPVAAVDTLPDIERTLDDGVELLAVDIEHGGAEIRDAVGETLGRPVEGISLSVTPSVVFFAVVDF
jgi:hypothetical protein